MLQFLVASWKEYVFKKDLTDDINEASNITASLNFLLLYTIDSVGNSTLKDF